MWHVYISHSVQFSHSVVSDSLWPHESQHARPPFHHHLLEFTQTHVHRVGDAIQPSHPLSSPSSPAPNPSQHQDLFQWVNSSHEVARVLEFQLQHQSFQWTPRTDLLLLSHKSNEIGTSLVVQWLRLWAPNAAAPKFSPWSGNKISHAATKIWCSQINKY